MLQVRDYSFIDLHNAKFLISSLFGAYITYYFFAVRSVPSTINLEVVDLADGGEVTLSWVNFDGMADDTPIVFLFPGLNSCSCSAYIISIVREISQCKYRCVVFNNRGTCRRKLKTARTYSASYTSDVAFVLNFIGNRYPNAPMIAVGLSLGALIIFNYLADKSGDCEAKCPLIAAMCICMPWDVLESSNGLEKLLNFHLFNKHLARGLCRVVKRNADVLSREYDVPRILKSRSVREFDENLTVDMFGYKSVDEYYADASPATKIDRVRIPILCLNAADDPFVPFSTLPLDAVCGADSRVVLALTRHGGHMGFLSGLSPTGLNLVDRAVPQFVSAIFEHTEEFAVAAAAADAGGDIGPSESDPAEESTSTLDGGEMTLSWSNLEGMDDGTPIVVLLPGLTGCGCCHYIASLVKEINQCQYRCVVSNNRGTCRHKLKVSKIRIHALIRCRHHKLTVLHTPLMWPRSLITFETDIQMHKWSQWVYLLGLHFLTNGESTFSLLVFNYLADEPQDRKKPCPLAAAMCVSMPWDVSQTSDKLEKSLDWLLFNYPLTHGLRRLVMRNADVLSKKYDVPRILKSRSVREFDENLTVDMFGYKSVDEYYADASPATKIDRVRVPILCLNAADDPFVPFSSEFV
ncbi:unnamed protein product [Hydatigera taeniaeformis]|uniref:Phospholipase ABHD3 n=1 Tax=Hydatigena taeniaeformis TaxID=6205 RepID=A0A0R3X7N5_HYDTA|nr:unnamed protein product [Hydatigera taeniaeformis]